MTQCTLLQAMLKYTARPGCIGAFVAWNSQETQDVDWKGMSY